jgi:hypothetical protein
MLEDDAIIGRLLGRESSFILWGHGRIAMWDANCSDV